MEFTAGGVKGALFFFPATMNKWSAVLMDCVAKQVVSRFLSLRRVVVKVADDLSSQHPKIVHMSANRPGGEAR